MKQLLHKSIIVILFVIASIQAKPQSWSVDFGDTLWVDNLGEPYPSQIYKIYKHTNKLFVFGAFNRIGTDTAAGFAYWDGLKWKPIVKSWWWSSGINDMKYYKQNLYVCGEFQQINSIANLSKLAKWDGTNWDFVCNDSLDVNSFYSILWHHDTLFVSGLFGLINGVNYRYVAQWDGTNWLQMENGIDDDLSDVYCNVVYNDQIHVGGHFSSASGHPAKAVARWDGQHWNAIGTGLLGQVQAMLVDTMTNTLYASGYLAVPGDPQNRVGSVAKWDGLQWTCLMDSTDSNAPTVCTYRGNIYIGGEFTYINNKPIHYLAKWNGVEWDSVGSFIAPAAIMTMAVFNDELIVGGGFTKVNGLHATGIARYYEPPDTACIYFNPAIYTDADTFYLHNDTVSVPFFNNNSHANTWAWNFGDSGTDTTWCPMHTYHQPGVFNVTVHVTELWCNGTAQKTIVILQGTNVNNEQRLTNADLRIFPNPANNSVTIIANLQQPNIGTLKITDAKGSQQAVYNLISGTNKITVATQNWKSGTYICNLLINNKIAATGKIIIRN